jgi:hypothetical protein
MFAREMPCVSAAWSLPILILFPLQLDTPAAGFSVLPSRESFLSTPCHNFWAAIKRNQRQGAKAPRSKEFPPFTDRLQHDN